jgi:hypothetical protein
MKDAARGDGGGCYLDDLVRSGLRNATGVG